MKKEKYIVSCEYDSNGKKIDDIVLEYIIFKLQQLGEDYVGNR